MQSATPAQLGAEGSARRQQLPPSAERSEEHLGVLLVVVGVKRDPEVPVPLGGDNSVRRERPDERGRVGRPDAEKRAATGGGTGRDDDGAELVEPVEQP